jgi:hypothetical protein
MATPIRPLSEDEARAALESWRRTADGSRIAGMWSQLQLATGERHQFVRYDAALGRVVYEDVDTFYFSDASPSDSRWMVPNYTKKKEWW